MKRNHLTVAILLFAVCCLVACNKNPAVSEPPAQTYTVKFYDFDDNKIFETQVKYDETATFEGDLPKIPATLEKCYPFSGWDKSLENVTSNLEVRPTHGEEYNISDFEFVHDPRVFQGATTFDNETTNFIGFLEYLGIAIYLKESVEKDGHYVSTDIVDYDDALVEYDFSNVDTATKGDYPFTVSVRGLVKESSIKVVTDTRTWTKTKEMNTHPSHTYDATLSGGLTRVYFYQDNKCLLGYYDPAEPEEFEPFTYEMADEGTAVIIRSEDGSADCKYTYGEVVGEYSIEGHSTYIVGTYLDFVHFDTAEDFTIQTTGYAFITARVEDAVFYLTPKYEYNPETKQMKLFAWVGFNSLTYNSETGELEYTANAE